MAIKRIELLVNNKTSLKEELRNILAEIKQKREIFAISHNVVAEIEQITGLKDLFKKLKKEEKNEIN